MHKPHLDPYHFNPEELHPHIQKYLEGTAEFEFEGSVYTYGKLNPEVAPVHYVVGMYGGQNLIASTAIPKDLLPLYLQHEILCNRVRAEEIGKCAATEAEMFENVSQELKTIFIQARRKTFEDLIVLNGVNMDTPTPGFHTEITGTTLFLRKKMEELGLK